jgi:hypothetical protein
MKRNLSVKDEMFWVSLQQLAMKSASSAIPVTFLGKVKGAKFSSSLRMPKRERTEGEIPW